MLTAIVGILLGNLLIATLFAPALQRLREILAKMAEIKLPFRSVWALLEERGEPSEAALQQAAKRAVSEFNLYFREYSIAFATFAKLGYIFAGSVALLACAVAWQTRLAIPLRCLAMAFSLGGVLILAWVLQRAIAPTPAEILTIDFLANNFANLHLEPLFDVAEPRINFGRALGSGDTVMHFSFFTNAMFLGYRLLFAVTDARCSKLYFIAYGPVNAKTYFQHVWRPDLASFRISLGDFPYLRPLKAAEHLYLHLWLFIPTPRGWVKEVTDHPRLLSEEINAPGIGVRLYSDVCRWTSLDTEVDFDSKYFLGFTDWKLRRVHVPAQDSPQQILKIYKQAIENSVRLTVENHPNGLPVRAE